MSDLHFEFHADGGARFLDELPDVDHDSAVIAGDLCDFKTLPRSLRLVSQRFQQVVYVLGNHECYGASIHRALDSAYDCCAGLDNVHFLECATVRMGHGIFTPGTPTSVHGATLWFPYREGVRLDGEREMTDFFQIEGLRREVGVRNELAAMHLRARTEPGDVVVTHHLPCVQSVHPKYAGSPLNAFFLGHAAHVATAKRPVLWVHGHTHESCDYMLGETRVVCNPYGYHGHEVNAGFKKDLVIDTEKGTS